MYNRELRQDYQCPYGHAIQAEGPINHSGTIFEVYNASGLDCRIKGPVYVRQSTVTAGPGCWCCLGKANVRQGGGER